MPAGPPPGVDQPRGHGINVLARLGGGGRTGPPEGGGRYGLLLVVLVGAYLFSAFHGAHLATETQIGLFSAGLLPAPRQSPLSGPGAGLLRPGPPGRPGAPGWGGAA